MILLNIFSTNVHFLNNYVNHIFKIMIIYNQGGILNEKNKTI